MQTMKKWQEPLFAIGGLGTSFMFTIQATYLLTRYMPSQADINGGLAVMLVVPWILSLLFLLSRLFDGLIDIPIASWTDSYFRKTGKRYPVILAGIVPMMLTYMLMWLAPVPKELSIWNIVWVSVCSILYFFSYTLVAVPYLSSLSDMVADQKSRVRVASWQSFFNTIGYCLAYTVVPLMREHFSNNSSLQEGMTTTALILSPVMLTMLIPAFFVLRKNSKDAAGNSQEPVKNKEAKLTMFESLKTTVKNKSFRIYLLAYMCCFFGLQLFLGGMDYLNRSIMGLTGWRISVMNAAAFAPIPIMLWLFNKINRKWGIKWAFRVGLLCFIVAMSIFTMAWTKLVGTTMPFYLGLIAGTFGSFSIGAFFAVPYAMPAQIAAEEAQQTGVNRCGMYFAVQGLVNQIVGAFAGSVILINVLNLSFGFFTDGAIFIGPIVIIACVLSYIFAGKLPGAVKSKAEAAE
ncbi:MAG: MFS transporter [Eubacteriales bacterium]|nr:MFS transporter [Eubacteriales bacterium]